MFSLECPKCKNEIPLGMLDCPVCAAKAATGDAPVSQPAVAPQTAQAVQASAPAAFTPPPPPSPAPSTASPQAQPVYALPQPRPGLPAWLVAVGVALLLAAVLGAGYFVLLPRIRGGASAGPSNISLEPPQQAATASASPAGGRFGKYVEVVGLRVIEENKKASVKFLLVNHSAAELTDVNGTVEIHSTNRGAMVGRVEVKVPSLMPYESREFSAPLNTPLRAYEIPDWQFLRGQFVE
ncbi:MAG: hypothetical protein IT163_17715 [Bryobacterales bacterium]|nr:hypothetical protein [Bryobacterales bacterium]